MITTPKKPVTRIVRAPDAPHGVASRLVLSVCPHSGTIKIREHGRREGSAVVMSLADIYTQALRIKLLKTRK